jgi:hypothetical protein
MIEEELKDKFKSQLPRKMSGLTMMTWTLDYDFENRNRII